MKIGIDARFYGPRGKGLGRYTTELIRSLEMIDTENDYVVFLRRENFDQYEPKNSRFRKVLADFRWYSLEEQIGFARALFRERCDLVHFPHFNVPLLYRRPFVVTVHDLILLRFPTLRATTLSPLLYRLKFLAYRAVIRNALFHSRKIITVSEYTKRDILNRYSIRAENISVTFEAAHDFCHTMSKEAACRIFRRLSLLEGEERGHFRDILRPYALYVGNAYPHKNLEALLSAFENFPDEEARLVLVGGDDYFSRRLKKLAREKRMKTVIFAGAVSDDVLDLLYRYARVSVFPSLYEGFGLPPLEAMAEGSPVIASSSAAFPEVLGDAALFFNPQEETALREALLALWNDESLRAKLREKGYRQSRRFSWETLGKETLSLYREAMDTLQTKTKYS